MAATLVASTSMTEASVALASVAADTVNGNSFDNTNGNVFVYVKNTHATNAHTFNFTVQTTSVTKEGYGTLTKATPTAVVVPALSDALVGPFPKQAYNDNGNLVQLTFSGTGTPRLQVFTGLGLVKG